MYIKIKEHTCTIITLEVDPSISIAEIKQHIFTVKNYPIIRQHLFKKHQELQNDKTLNDYHIKKDTIINLVVLHPPNSSSYNKT